nr:9160_t:CDS:2 [Entrophospora candida]
MSVGTQDPVILSRLQLARALKEDLDNVNAEPPENSAIFIRQRTARNSRVNSIQSIRRSSYSNNNSVDDDVDEDEEISVYYLPKPKKLIVPPVLAKNDDKKNNNGNGKISKRHTQLQKLQPIQPQYQSLQPPSPLQPPSQPSSPSSSQKQSRNNSIGKPTTLLDVRESMLETRQNIHNNMIHFNASSSHRTSLILQQGLPTKSHGSKLNNSPAATTSSRPTSMIVTSPLSTPQKSPRPSSSYFKTTPSSNNNNKLMSIKTDNLLYANHDNDDNVSPLTSHNSKLSTTPKNRKNSSSSSGYSSDDSNNKSKSKSKSIQQQKNSNKSNSSSSSASSDENQQTSTKRLSSSMSTKPKPKIKVQNTNPHTQIKNGARIEAWIDSISNQSPSSSSSSLPLTSSEPIVPGITSPRSTTDDSSSPKPQYHSSRKRSNSEHTHKSRNISTSDQPPQLQLLQLPHLQLGRTSPSPKQDSDWAKDTLQAFDDFRLSSTTDDSSSSNSSSNNLRLVMAIITTIITITIVTIPVIDKVLTY